MTILTAGSFMLVNVWLDFCHAYVISPYGTTEDGLDDDNHTGIWYQIVTHHKECRCLLAIDIDSFQSDCPGTRLVACPYDPNKISQQWKWDGRMLISRRNGLAMDLQQPPGRNIVLAYPQNTQTQRFSTYLFDHHIYTNYGRFDRPKVIDIHLRPTSMIGTNVTYYEMHPYNATNQLFDIRRANFTGTRKLYNCFEQANCCKCCK